ncbi:MAG: hypothetical protein HFK07_04990 [Clostridia bacterium]|jgi:fructosamine-3-kinase|nr:hypothetical protein [Clostridia bacterium]MCX4367247.1 fructosamine kinase family protein [Clostridia bacterium]
MLSKAEECVKNIIYIELREHVEYLINIRRELGYSIYNVRTQDNNEYSVKIYKEDNKHRKEEEELYRLRKMSLVNVPKVIRVTDKSKDIPYDALILSKISGSYNVKFFLRKKKREKVAREIIDNMIAVSQDKGDGKFGDVTGKRYVNYIDYLEDRYKVTLMKARFLLEKKKITFEELMRAEELYNNIKQVFGEEEIKPALVHGYYSLDNIRIDVRNGEIKIVVNPLNSFYGDEEYNLVNLMTPLGKKYKLFEIYKEKKGISNNFNKKAEIYRTFFEIEEKYGEMTIGQLEKKRMRKRYKNVQ